MKVVSAFAAVPDSIRFCTLPGSPLREFYLLVPATVQPGGPLLVLVHGISRRAVEHLTRFARLAEGLGVTLIAPYFAKSQFGQYQQVIDRSGNRADTALLDIVDAVASSTDCDGEKFHAFGFSGGAQFAHRFAMIHPDRVRSFSIAAAGWYTMPDPEVRYPYGICTHPLPGSRFEPERFLSIDRHVFVGAADQVRDETLKSNRRLDERQGATRLERAERWAAAMDAASNEYGVWPTHSTFEVLRGVGHSFASAARRRHLPARVLSKVFGCSTVDFAPDGHQLQLQRTAYE